MAKNHNDDKPEEKPKPFNVEYDPDFYDEYDDNDFGFDFYFGEDEVY